MLLLPHPADPTPTPCVLLPHPAGPTSFHFCEIEPILHPASLCRNSCREEVFLTLRLSKSGVAHLSCTAGGIWVV